MDKITFEHGETEKSISVTLINEKVNKTAADLNKEEFGDGTEEIEELQDLMFKIVIDKAHPEGVKISKKNACIVTIVQTGDEDADKEGEAMLQYFLQTKEPTWGQQFKNAALLGPQIDEDNLIVDHVTMFEAFFHFACINWKMLFAIVPPSRYGGGWPCFIVALLFIGIITAIVGEVATILGCSAGIEPSITAITLVAMGTSLPDTFASITAVKTSKYADSAIGNVTGSNCVNVFLGLGLPWVIAA